MSQLTAAPLTAAAPEHTVAEARAGRIEAVAAE
jgi:hypothetical protein